MFDQSTTEQLGYYVYALFDPRPQEGSNLPLYVGKGIGNRVFAHANSDVPTKKGTVVSPKLELIRRIRAENRDVEHVVIRHGMTEREALLVEASLIDIVNWCEPGRLTNLVAGYEVDKGIRTALDLACELQAQPLEVDGKLLLLKIEAQWTILIEKYRAASLVPDSDIYNAVRASWPISVNNAKEAQCILAVARGIVRGVYVADSWFESADPGRREFHGRAADAKSRARYMGRSVAMYFSKGGRNPMRYLGWK